eukprot:274987-Prymnesium_polylepis.3
MRARSSGFRMRSAIAERPSVRFECGRGDRADPLGSRKRAKARARHHAARAPRCTHATCAAGVRQAPSHRHAARRRLTAQARRRA